MSFLHNIRSSVRHLFKKKDCKQLKNDNFSIFSSNCIGGVLYHDYGMKFLSPTINLWMSPSDFIKFCSNPSKYLTADFVSVPLEVNYPVAKCEDITLHLLHYTSLENAQKDWRRRASRINWKNLYIIMTERDGCTEDDLLNFDSLPYANKIVFVHKPMPEIKSSFYIPGTEMKKTDPLHKIISLTDFVYRVSYIRFLDKFDWIEFFNTGKRRLTEKSQRKF
ncbi:MAG: DUF1919 domain-containing protein [Elusimicrobiaceae bacterium]|nr:DUF1919 domain-containing protein [Elusimicrobiaceae bacterium]